MTVSLIVKLVTCPLSCVFGCTLAVPKETSSLRAPAAINALRISPAHPFNCASAAEVVACVLATLAIHWNVLDVTAFSAEPVIVI